MQSLTRPICRPAARVRPRRRRRRRRRINCRDRWLVAAGAVPAPPIIATATRLPEACYASRDDWAPSAPARTGPNGEAAILASAVYEMTSGHALRHLCLAATAWNDTISLVLPSFVRREPRPIASHRYPGAISGNKRLYFTFYPFSASLYPLDSARKERTSAAQLNGFVLYIAESRNLRNNPDGSVTTILYSAI